MKVNLFIIGAGKSGTTSLWNFLNLHPQVYMCPTKEPSYFSLSKHFDRGEGWYHSLFTNYRDQLIVGEASNSYSATETFPQTPSRIFKYNPKAKLIYIVRHPMDRTASDWMESNKRKPIPFSDFIKCDNLCRDKNNYLKQYKAYLEYFSEKSILILTFDQITSDFSNASSQVFDFLGIKSVKGQLINTRPTASQRKYSQVFYWANQSNIYARIRQYIPNSARRFALQLTSRKYESIRPKWSRDDRVWFRNAYREPTEHFFLEAKLDLPDWQW